MARLTDPQKRELADLLDRRYQDLLDDVRHELEGSGEPRMVALAGHIYDADVGNEPIADLLQDLSLGSIDRYVTELREIQDARRRMYDGTYGECIECGDDIGYERLRAWPTAARCIDDQEAYDRSFGNRTSPAL